MPQFKLAKTAIEKAWNEIIVRRVGSVGLLKQDLLRGVWKMGIITELISRSDGKFRGAKVFLPTKTVLKGPLNLLYPLESGNVQEIETTQNGEQLKNCGSYLNHFASHSSSST